MKITAKEEALASAKAIQDRVDTRVNEYIEAEIAEWEADPDHPPIQLVFETKAEQRAASRILEFYAAAGWKVTADEGITQAVMK